MRVTPRSVAPPLGEILEAESQRAVPVLLPASGRNVHIRSFLRHEERAGAEIPRAGSCWAPNKPALLFDGQAIWAEFVLVRLLERAGWEARWIKNWTGGREFCLDVDRPRDLPAGPSKVFSDLHKRASILRGAGSWDIFAWSGNDYLFLESKQHRSSDKLNANQVVWLEAALDEGFTLDQFAIVEYDARRPAPGQLRGMAVAKQPSGPMPVGLIQLLAAVRTIDKSQRIDSRNDVVEFGAAAIEPMKDWLENAELRRFAIAVLERMGGAHPRAVTALRDYAARGASDGNLAQAAIERLRGAASGENRTTSAPRTGVEYRSTGNPPPKQEPCEMTNRNGTACENQGRWPVSSVWICTTHYKARVRRTGSL